MSDATQPPADVRERIKAAIREGVKYIAKADGAYLYEPSVDETADRILALLRTPRGEGEEDGGEFCDLCGEMFDPSELGTVIGPLGQDDGVPRWYRCPRCARAYDAGYQQGQRDPRGDETADPTALRSETAETPRGDGEAEPVAWRVEYRLRGVGDARWYHLSTYTNEMDARDRAKHAEAAMRVLECRIIPLYASPAAALRSEAQGDAEALAAEILAELRRARQKFPDNNVMTLALVEEVGELAKATFEESRDRVRQEAIQVAVMAMRVVLDGDQTLDAWREAKGLDPLVVAARRGEGGGA